MASAKVGGHPVPHTSGPLGSSTPPDVAIFIPSFAGGGAERVAFFAAEALHRHGWQVDLVVAVGRGALRERSVAGVRIVVLNALTEILALPQYLAYLRRARPRLVIAMVHTAKLTAGLGSLFRPQIPFIASVHLAVNKDRAVQWWFRRWFGFWSERRLYRRAVAVHAVSRALAAEAQQTLVLPPERMRVIYNPATHVSSAVELQGDPVEEGGAFILGIGRLVKQKDFATLIRAFAMAVEQKADRCDKLVILGEGPERASLEALALALGIADRVKMPGFVHNPAAYLSKATCLVLSSRAEGFALVILEALSLGTRVIATDCPHGPRELLGGGRFGTLVTVGDAPAIAAAIGNLPTAAPIDKAALADHLLQFDGDRVADAYHGLVAEFLVSPTQREAIDA